MDMSKLPKLSETPKPPDNSTPPPSPERPPSPRPVEYAHEIPPSVGAEAWISIAIGIVVLLMTSRFFTSASGTTFSDAQGLPLRYSQTVFFIHDLGLVIFGFALVLDGVLLFVARPWAVMLGLAIAVVAALANVYTIVRSSQLNMGFQIMPALAFVFAVYIAIHQWKVLQLLKGRRQAPMT